MESESTVIGRAGAPGIDPAASGRPLRIGIGGIHIECSTFSPHVTTDDDFLVTRGQALLDRYAFTRAGAEAWAADVDWVPLVHARAVPGGSVHPDTYERLAGELTERLRAATADPAGPLDGLLFDIHGAMHVLGRHDIEAQLAEAVRAVVGPDCLISTPTDLHGSVTPELVAQVDLLTAHRLAPHEDEWETRARAARLLVRCLREGIRPMSAYVRIPVLLPGEKTSTREEPARGIYASLADVERTPGVLDAAVWVGYAWADEPRSAAAAVVCGTDQGVLRDEAAKLAARYWAARDEFEFVGPTASAEEAVRLAVECGIDGGVRPFVISDSGDNPTAGGGGDTADLLAVLLADRRIVRGELPTVYAGVFDPAAVAACETAGVGGAVDMAVGGHLEGAAGRPARVAGTVEFLTGDDVTAEGVSRGPMAVVRAGAVRVVLTARRKPFHKTADFTRLGLDPFDAAVVVVKIGYLEPELHELAAGWVIALTPGGVDQDLLRLGHRELRRPLHPFDVFDPLGDPAREPAMPVRVFRGGQEIG